MRAANGSMLPPVAGTCQRFQTTPPMTCNMVWVRINASPVPVERARHGRADGRHRWAIDAPGLLLLTSRLQGVPHERPVLADVGDRIGGTIGREDPGVVGLTTTGGVEHSAVECHAVVVDRNHLRIHRALIGVAQVQLIGCDGVLV